MPCLLNRSYNYIYLGKHPISREFGGVVCVSGDRFILASKHSPDIYLVEKDTIISSCVVPKYMWEIQGEYNCLGVTLSFDQSELFVLVASTDHFARILRFSVQGDTISPSHASPFYLPQHSIDHVYSEVAEISWDRDGLLSQLPFSVFEAGGSFLEFFPDTPIGRLSPAHPSFITSYQDKLVLGINHIQYVKVPQKHILPHISESEFLSWVVPVTSIDYTKNFWWAHTYKEEEIQEDGPCLGTVECPICGCEQECTCNRNVPLWDEDGEPIMLMAEIDKVTAQLCFSHPVLISSIVLLNYMTGEIEGITHIGANAFGTAPIQPPRNYITGLGVKDTELEVALCPIPSTIPKSYLAWGEEPYQLPANIGNAKPSHTVQTLLEWWGTQHLPYIEQNGHRLLGEGRNIPTFQTTFSFTSLMNSAPTANISYTVEGIGAPYNHLDQVTDIDFSKRDNMVYVTTANQVFQYANIGHEFITEFGQGADIYVGQVLRNVEKIVPVTVVNPHDTVTLINFRVRRIADVAQPYYQFIHLSVDQTSWEPYIDLPPLPPGESTTFYIRVMCDSTQRVPKAVSVTASYHKVYV